MASPKYEQVLSIIPLWLALLVPLLVKTWHYKSIDYYQRFLNLATGEITKEEYFQRYDDKVNRDYKVAEYLLNRTTTADRVFIWGDSSPIYALSRRFPPTKYLTSFHINDLPDKTVVINDIKTNPPKFIIITPKATPFPSLMEFLNADYVYLYDIDGAQIWKK